MIGWVDAEVFRRITRGNGLFSAPAVEAGQRICVALDVLDRWAGVFEFSLRSNGNADTDGVLYYRDDHGDWGEAVSGGGSYAAWGVPWSPSTHAWDGDAVLRLGCSGKDFDGGDGEPVLVLVHIGFVRQDVAHIEIDNQREQRLIEVTSPVGGFAALTFGRRPTTFRFLDDGHAALGRSTYTPHL